jgi:general secretion pathway protein M
MSQLTNTINGWRSAAASFWSVRTEQERKMLTVGGAVLAFGLVYGLLIDPALSGRARLEKSLPQLHQQVAELQALAGEAAQLASQTPVTPPPLTRDALQANLQTRGLTPASLTVTGDYAKMEFKGVAFAGLVTWLDAARREQRLVVQDANVTSLATPGQVDATVTLRQDAGAR